MILPPGITGSNVGAHAVRRYSGTRVPPCEEGLCLSWCQGVHGVRGGALSLTVEDDEHDGEDDGPSGNPPGTPAAIRGFVDCGWCGGGSRAYSWLVDGRFSWSNQLTHSPAVLGGAWWVAWAADLRASLCAVGKGARCLRGSGSSSAGS